MPMNCNHLSIYIYIAVIVSIYNNNISAVTYVCFIIAHQHISTNFIYDITLLLASLLGRKALIIHSLTLLTSYFIKSIKLTICIFEKKQIHMLNNYPTLRIFKVFNFF